MNYSELLQLAKGWGNFVSKAIAMLDEVKESIINAYEIKTGLSRAKLSHLMDAETWINRGIQEIPQVHEVLGTLLEGRSKEEEGNKKWQYR